MHLLVQELTVKNKTWRSFFFRSEIKIAFNEHEISMYSVSDLINIAFEAPALFRLRITKDGKVIKKKVALEAGRNTIVFSNSVISGRLVVFYIESVWGFLDSEIETPGVYRGRGYFFNEATCETSFDSSFVSSESKFPSFVRITADRVYFADTENKIITRINPAAKQEAIREYLKKFSGERRKALFGSMTRIEVDRANILRTGAVSIMRNIRSLVRSIPIIVFSEEMGEDYGAIRREFFYLAFREILGDHRLARTGGVFDVSEDSRCPEFLYDNTFTLDIIEDVAGDHGDIENDDVFYIFLGILFAYFLCFNETLRVNFSLAFYENLLDRKFTARHIQDPEFQRSILRCMREKIPEYDAAAIEEAINDKLFAKKKNAYDFIRVGFGAIIPERPHGLSAFDFPFIYYNFEPISIKTLSTYVHYDRCDRNTQEVRWLWEILERKDQEYLCRFLQFFTGSGNLERFSDEHKFWFERLNARSPFFKASSCSRRLFFGKYSSREEMEYYLNYSIFNTEGFHKV